jgi:hypothetical protein
VDGSYFGSAPEAVLDGEAGLAGDEAPDGAAEDDAADTAGAAELPPLEPQAPTPAASATPKIIGIQILRMESRPLVFSVPPSICRRAEAAVRRTG